MQKALTVANNCQCSYVLHILLFAANLLDRLLRQAPGDCTCQYVSDMRDYTPINFIDFDNLLRSVHQEPPFLYILVYEHSCEILPEFFDDY